MSIAIFASSCTTTELPAVPVTIQLLSHEIETVSAVGGPYQRWQGTFEMKNAGQRTICLMRDVIENTDSPDVHVITNRKPRIVRGNPGLPPPRLTLEIAELEAGGSVRFRKDVQFAQVGPATAKPVAYKLRLHVWGCPGASLLPVQSPTFLFDPQSAQPIKN